MSTPALEILEEGYLIQWVGQDPSTGQPFKPSWVCKGDCAEELVDAWEAKRKYQGGPVVRSGVDQPCGCAETYTWTAQQHSAKQDSETTAQISKKETISCSSQRPNLSRPVRLFEDPPNPLKRCSATPILNKHCTKGISEQGDVFRYKKPRVDSNTPVHQSSSENAMLTAPEMSAAEPKLVRTIQPLPPKPERASTNVDIPCAGLPAKPATGLPLSTVPREAQVTELHPNALVSVKESSGHWLEDNELIKSKTLRGVYVELQESDPRSRNHVGSGRYEGAYENQQGVILSILLADNAAHEMIARVKLLDAQGTMISVPIYVLSPVPPSEPGQHGLILKGRHRGSVAKVREGYEGRWFVSIGKSLHFETAYESLARIMVDIENEENVRL